MKLDYNGSVPPYIGFSITKTEDLNANRLLALFLGECDILNILFSETESVKLFSAMVQDFAETKSNFKLCDYLTNFLGTLCDCFLEFLATCSHIHVLID